MRPAPSQALKEVFVKNRLPLPDSLSPTRFTVPTDVMDFACDRITMVKQGPNVYRVAVQPTAGKAGETAISSFGFDLTFTATKPPVRNGIDGVSPGVSSDDAMFYYSITRMRAEGTVTLPHTPPPASDGNGEANGDAAGGAGRTVAVSGEGWYDHEFGGNSSGGVQVDVQWAWTGMQLSDGTEVTYAKTMDNVGKGTIVDKAVVVDKAGTSVLRSAELTQTGTWTSLETFIAYGRSWTLKVPEEELELELTAVADAQARGPLSRWGSLPPSAHTVLPLYQSSHACCPRCAARSPLCALTALAVTIPARRTDHRHTLLLCAHVF